MSVKIYTIHLGFDQCYLLQGDGLVLIDCGEPGKIEKFKKCLIKLKIDPKDINLIVATHGHWDHIGSAKEIKDLTGAKLAMHKNEKDWLEKSLIILPPGVTRWGRIFKMILSVFTPKIKIPPAKVDLVLDEKRFSLAEFGIPGSVYYTPGHSSGSVSILLDSGEAFVGDLLMNRFPLTCSPGPPIFAEDVSKVKQSIEFLIEKRVKTIYPSHGYSFSAGLLDKIVRKCA